MTAKDGKAILKEQLMARLEKMAKAKAKEAQKEQQRLAKKRISRVDSALQQQQITFKQEFVLKSKKKKTTGTRTKKKASRGESKINAMYGDKF